MAKGMRVSGMGKKARRTDLDRAKRVMREAKISEATGGPRGQRSQLADIESQGPMPTPASAVSANMSRTAAANIPVVGAFDPTQYGDLPVSTGAGGKSAGAGPEMLMTPVDAPDQIVTFARAMYLMNPTPQMRRMLEAFEEEGR